ncbi:MAG: IclR family transcriptional regulator [Parvularculaceae bacterium]|nr:IclR family transcriptional regulator [Parvularculaceae bacterium]
MTDPKTITKALQIFTHAIRSEGAVTAKDLSTALKLPLATTYRHIAVLEKSGLLRRTENSQLEAGIFLLELFRKEQFLDLLAEAARPVVQSLSQEMATVSQLGVFDQDMVTYLVKAEPEGGEIFTRENEQLEAYCSGIGKVLLAGLPNTAFASYLTTGPFPALTKQTITDERDLKTEIRRTQRRGYAIDNGEIDEGLFCIAVPVRNLQGNIIAGLSISSHDPAFVSLRIRKRVSRLHIAADKIVCSVFKLRNIERPTPR